MELKELFSIFSIFWIITIKEWTQAQLSENTPPTMWLDRHWQIPETEEIGTVIIRVHGSDNEDDRLEYGLEPKAPSQRVPFRIDNNTGVVYLNESLKGRAGENIFLYVTVSDGHLAAKTEVFVNIVNTTSRGKKPVRPPVHPSNYPFNIPSPPIFHPHNQNLPPPPISIPSNHPYSPGSGGSTGSNGVHLQPIDINSYTTINTKYRSTNLNNPQLHADIPNHSNHQNSSTNPNTSTPEGNEDNKKNGGGAGSEINNEIHPPHDQPVRSGVQGLAVTLVPVISVCAIFIVVGVIALVFRKKLCLARSKHCKDKDIRKDSGGIAVVQEDLAMQQWRGPRAFSNRYEPWERDNNNPQVGGTQLEPANDRWEFPRHRLKFFNILGEGAFGQVWKCEAIDIDDKEGVSIVAVKTLKENASEKERLDLQSELSVMKMLEPHPNVVRLLAACTEKDPLFVIMEFVSKGKLQSYLRNSRAERYYNNMHGPSKSLTSRDLTSFCYQVAKGMEYLASNGIIHRDLAARNILINDEHTCKVADFGFARDVIDSHVYERKSEGRLPIRWMAPESLYDNIFSTKSDVWSFGVLIWEVVTLGSTPYPGLSAADVMRKVRDGHRLDKPEHCRRELYNIMYYCWDKDPKQRPPFAECIQLLEKLLMTETDYIELERFPDHSYYNMLNISDEKL